MLFFMAIALAVLLLWQPEVVIDLYGENSKFAFIAMSLQIF